MNTLRTMSRDSKLPRLEMQMLWRHVLQVPRSWLIAHDTDPLANTAIVRFRELEARRLAGEPMAYIVGYREFMEYEFLVSPAVLIPRPETELLVETGLDYLKGKRSPRVLDLGTGSGAVAVSIALRCPGATVVATDLSSAALEVARANARLLGAQVDFLQGGWYDALAGRKDFDLIVSNPPYIAAADSHLKEGDLRFEPVTALTDGSDGLSALRVIIEGAAGRLLAGGALFVEHGWDQSQDVRQLLQSTGFKRVASAPDLAGIDRVTGGIYN